VHDQCTLNPPLIKWREAYWCNFSVLVVSSTPPPENFSANTLGAQSLRINKKKQLRMRIIKKLELKTDYQYFILKLTIFLF